MLRRYDPLKGRDNEPRRLAVYLNCFLVGAIAMFVLLWLLGAVAFKGQAAGQVARPGVSKSDISLRVARPPENYEALPPVVPLEPKVRRAGSRGPSLEQQAQDEATKMCKAKKSRCHQVKFVQRVKVTPRPPAPDDITKLIAKAGVNP